MVKRWLARPAFENDLCSENALYAACRWETQQSLKVAWRIVLAPEN